MFKQLSSPLSVVGISRKMFGRTGRATHVDEGRYLVLLDTDDKNVLPQEVYAEDLSIPAFDSLDVRVNPKYIRS